MNCQIEFANDDIGMPCGKPAVAKCADCWSAICSNCRTWCCGQSFCEVCGDYHRTHSCFRKSAQNEQQVFSRKVG